MPKFKKDEFGRFLITVSPKQGVVLTNPGERALASMFDSGVVTEPEGEWQEDLVGDSFLTSYKSRPTLTDDENVPPARTLNHELLKWTMEKAEFQKSRVNTVGNIPASLMSSSLLWETLITDDALKSAREAQAKAEEKQKEAEEKFKEMAEKQAQGDQEGANAAQQAGQKAMLEAQMHADLIKNSVEKLKKNPLGQGMMANAIDTAAEEGEKINAAMKTWGIEPDEISMDDMTDVQKLAALSDLRDLSDLIGRFEGIAANTITAVKAGYTGTVTTPDTTKDITRLFPLERGFISQIAPRYIRVQRLHRFLTGGGLLGWKPKTEGKRRGSFVGMVDKSGSMSGWGGSSKLAIAKAVSLGISRALLNDQSVVEREFSLHYFDASDVETMKESYPVVTGKSSWREFVDWASVDAGGGTIFDNAFSLAMDEIKELADRGVHGVDLLFITDEESYLSDETIQKWNELKSEIGCNLILVSIVGGYWSGRESQVRELGDLVIQVDEAAFVENADEIVTGITTTIVKGELSAWGTGGGD